MTVDIVQKNTKAAFYLQVTWCVLLSGVAASWLYQNYVAEASVLLFATAIYLAFAVAYRKNNTLTWLCFAPAFGAIIITAPPLASLWCYFYASAAGEPVTANLIGATGIMVLNSTIGVILPALIGWKLLQAYRTTRSVQR